MDENSELIELLKSTEGLISQFAVTPLINKDAIQRQTHAIQSNFSSIRGLMRNMEAYIEELDSDEEQQQIATLLTSHKTAYQKLQSSLTLAALEQRRTISKAAADARSELLSSSKFGTADDALAAARRLTSDSDAIRSAKGATEGLRRTRAVLAEEIEHTSTTLATMEVSHHRLGQTKDEYHGQHGVMKKSKGLLKVLDWQNRSETYMLWLGLFFFLLTAAYVVQKRTIYFVPEALRPVTLVRSAGGLFSGQRGEELNRKGVAVPPDLPPVPGRKKKKAPLKQQPPSSVVVSLHDNDNVVEDGGGGVVDGTVSHTEVDVDRVEEHPSSSISGAVETQHHNQEEEEVVIHTEL